MEIYLCTYQAISFLHLLMLSSTKNSSLAAKPLQSRDYQILIPNYLILKISQSSKVMTIYHIVNLQLLYQTEKPIITKGLLMMISRCIYLYKPLVNCTQIGMRVNLKKERVK